MTKPAMPRTVWALGFVSLFMDLSSEIIHGLLPLFLTVTLGASVAAVGVIDGIAEATASISKVFSGWLSDRMGRRKPLILLGYGLAALSKPLFPLAGSIGVVLGARFADRIGKGLRGAPRDALVADVTPAEIRGRAFGLRQAMDTVGAFAGPLLAVGLMVVFSNDMRAVFWVALVPAALAVLCVLVGVDDPPRAPGEAPPPIRFAELKALGSPFWNVVAIGVVFTLARFSEAFLVLRATGEGLPLALAPLVLVAMNAVYSLGAYPAGVLADRMAARTLLLWGLLVLIGEGLMAKMVADVAPARVRGSAFGLFNLASGVAMLVASVVAGVLWDAIGPQATFAAGGVFALLALLLALVRRRG
ncbi:MAG: MFS transporter [Alphaproteobacteria bacterium]|nr:MAG: MFS transporter [Alphaproteobacteria bacterium]